MTTKAKKADAIQRNDRSVIFNSGQVVRNAHTADNCAGDVCPIHKPSDHELIGYPLFFNGRYMVRIVGGEWKIDPDDYNFKIDGKAILRNSATCKNCGDSIISQDQHDFKTCQCGAISVDGGTSYLRRSANFWENFIDTSITVGKVPDARI